ncbi:MAG: hypothetical protein ACLQMF_04895 [Rectinemataceae bacterium]
MKADIIVKDAVLRSSGEERVDIAISGGMIAAIAPSVKEDAIEVIDAGGNLVTESFAFLEVLK